MRWGDPALSGFTIGGVRISLSDIAVAAVGFHAGLDGGSDGATDLSPSVCCRRRGSIEAFSSQSPPGQVMLESCWP